MYKEISHTENGVQPKLYLKLCFASTKIKVHKAWEVLKSENAVASWLVSTETKPPGIGLLMKGFVPVFGNFWKSVA